MYEQWKVIPKTGEFYEISSLGRVRSYRGYGGKRLVQPKIIKPHLNKKRGYLYIALGGVRYVDLAAEYGVGYSTIAHIMRGSRWKLAL